MVKRYKANKLKKEMKKMGKTQEIVSLMSMLKSDNSLLTGDFKIFQRYIIQDMWKYWKHAGNMKRLD